MRTKGLLVLARDGLGLALGFAGVIHEEFFTHSDRPWLLGLYLILIVGVTSSAGRKLARTFTRGLADSDEDEDRDEEESITPGHTRS